MAAPFKRLWITEKPDMAKNLAAGLCAAYKIQVLNASRRVADGYLELSNGDRVSYLFGHMIEMEPPSSYLTVDQNRNRAQYFSFLPLIPPEFKFRPKGDMKDGKFIFDKAGKPVPPAQFKNILKLINSAREIVNAGDVDREGQLIVDELLVFAGIDPAGTHKPIYRFHMVSPKEDDIAKQLLAGPLERNGDLKWKNKGVSAGCRQTADWLLGMNASMAWQAVTGVNTISVGRVQTPTLAMVVNRDLTIENFKAVDYFVPVITMADGTEMRWHQRAGAEGQPGFDLEGRIIDRRLAEEIVKRISQGMRGTITKATRDRLKELPPLPFSLGTLQSTAAKEHGLELKEVTKAAQALYEKHKMISYVGTDCQFLPESQLSNSRETMAGLSQVFGKHASRAQMDLRSRAWNDNKVDEHFAIIPNGTIATGLTAEERAVFGTIAKRYMAQFYPAYEYIKNSLHADFGMDEFRATSREDVRLGWKEVEGMGSEGESDGSDGADRDEMNENHVHGEVQ